MKRPLLCKCAQEESWVKRETDNDLDDFRYLWLKYTLCQANSYKERLCQICLMVQSSELKIPTRNVLHSKRAISSHGMVWFFAFYSKDEANQDGYRSRLLTLNMNQQPIDKHFGIIDRLYSKHFVMSCTVVLLMTAFHLREVMLLRLPVYCHGLSFYYIYISTDTKYVNLLHITFIRSVLSHAKVCPTSIFVCISMTLRLLREKLHCTQPGNIFLSLTYCTNTQTK